MQRSILAFLFITVIFAGICILLRMTRHTTYIPITPPDDFTFVLTEGGGMDPNGSLTALRGKNAHTTSWTYEDGVRKNEETTFTLNEEEYRAFYKLLRTYGADTIAQSSDSVKDADNAGFSLSWDDLHIVVSGAMVPKSDEQRYTKIYASAHAIFTAAQERITP